MSRIQTLHESYDKCREAIQTVERSAENENRDLSDSEAHEHEVLVQRSVELETQIKQEGARLDSINEVQAIMAKHVNVNVNRSAPAEEQAPASMAEWMTARFREQYSDGGLVHRAVADQVMADTSVPKVYVQELIKLNDASRPVASSFTSVPFVRASAYQTPRVTQRVLVAEHTVEKAELASRAFTTTLDDWTTHTWAGTLDVANEVIDLQPDFVFSEIIQDFSDMYFEVTEQAACTYLASAASASAGWVVTDPGTIAGSIGTGVKNIYNASKRVADTLWLSLDETLELANMYNTLTTVSALSLFKQSLSDAGFRVNVITGPGLPANTRILGVKSQIKFGEKVNGLISAPNVGFHGTDIAYSGYTQFRAYAPFFTKLV